MTSPIANVIAGERRTPSGSGEYRREDPCAPERLLAAYRLSAASDVDDAVAAAGDAFRSWRRTPLFERCQVLARAGAALRARIEEIASVVQREIGKTRVEAEGEIRAAANLFDLYAGEATRYGGETLQSIQPRTHLYTERRSLGVCGLISPWNYPVSIPAWKIAPALLCGNTAVWKPSLQHPLSTMAVMDVLEAAGVPPGVVNLVHGDGPDIGQAIVDHPGVAAVSFTGSRRVGHAIYRDASARHARVSCEMGGKNALVVMTDADFDLAVDCAIMGGLSFGGQKCTGTDLIIVERSVSDLFCMRLQQRMGRIVVAAPTLDGTFYGPLVDAAQTGRVAAMVERAAAGGATIACGGSILDAGPYFYAPTLVRESDPSSEIATEEIFGPVLVLVEIADLDEAIGRVNATDYGLGASICTNNLAAAHHFIEEVETGLAYVNRPTSGAEFHAPFGGIKASGLGMTEQGLKVLEFYSHWRTVAIRYAS